MRITYIHHSCYAVECEEALLVFDYWQDPNNLLHNMISECQKQVYFLVSHFHDDHYNPEILELDARRIVSYDAKKRRRIPDEKATAVMRMDEVYEDELIRVTALKSTDVGVCYLVEADGERLFHAGDYNNWYFERGDEHLKVSAREMEGLFLATLRKAKSAAGEIDHLMFPIDPRLEEHTLRGIRQWLKAIPSHHLYPMHTWQQDIAPYLDELQQEYNINIHWQK